MRVDLPSVVQLLTLPRSRQPSQAVDVAAGSVVSMLHHEMGDPISTCAFSRRVTVGSLIRLRSLLRFEREEAAQHRHGALRGSHVCKPPACGRQLERHAKTLREDVHVRLVLDGVGPRFIDAKGSAPLCVCRGALS